MYCRNCGKELTEREAFCQNCGVRLSMPPLTPPAANLFGTANDSFFGIDEYIIDEKISAFKFTNAYKVFDANGDQIGSVEQQKVSGGQKAARILLGGNVKAMQSFRLDIKDMNGSVLITIQRGGISSGIGGMRSVGLFDGGGLHIATIKILFSMWTLKQEILDPSGNTIGRIEGDWKGWNFTIFDTNGAVIGAVNKKWNGMMKEFFTTADKYHISISPQTAGIHRIAIVAAAVTLDMMLKEFK
jgi:uncharacterized protein YxjI